MDIKGKSVKFIGWFSFVGSVLAFGLGVTYLYAPHLDMAWATNITLYADVVEYWKSNAWWLPWVMDIGILCIAIGIMIFCFHQFFAIWSGKKDVEDWPE